MIPTIALVEMAVGVITAGAGIAWLVHTYRARKEG